MPHTHILSFKGIVWFRMNLINVHPSLNVTTGSTYPSIKEWRWRSALQEQYQFKLQRQQSPKSRQSLTLKAIQLTHDQATQMQIKRLAQGWKWVYKYTLAQRDAHIAGPWIKHYKGCHWGGNKRNVRCSRKLCVIKPPYSVQERQKECANHRATVQCGAAYFIILSTKYI